MTHSGSKGDDIMAIGVTAAAQDVVIVTSFKFDDLTEQEMAQRVKRDTEKAVIYCDWIFPDWPDIIDASTFDMCSSEDCLLSCIYEAQGLPFGGEWDLFSKMV